MQESYLSAQLFGTFFVEKFFLQLHEIHGYTFGGQDLEMRRFTGD